jgi:CheY-like chemotaxis protein
MKKTLLIIDDEVDFCYFLQKNLEATNEYEVSTCNSGEEGLIKAKLTHPDLIILDIMMPGMAGPDVADALKRDEATRNIPVVFLTAIIQEQEAKLKQNIIGGWYYMAKPVKLKDLISMIKKLTK